MHLSIAATLLACAAGHAQAFSDSAPFILFSTAELPPASITAQLQTNNQVLASAKELLASCPTSRYVLLSQPNLHAADIRDNDNHDGNGCRMPNLCRTIGEKHVYGVAEVIGQVSGKPLGEYITKVCGEKGKAVDVERVELKHLPAVAGKEEGRRGEVLADNDHELGRLLETLGDDYTVVMFSDPNEFKPYEPEFAEPLHMDMKRWSEGAEVVARDDSNSTRNLPLFEKYQFFTPGIFMSLITLILLLSILGVGLRALSSLEVSYGAFDKDMGPAAQKKQL